jgi:predicted Zn-dependent protease
MIQAKKWLPYFLVLLLSSFVLRAQAVDQARTEIATLEALLPRVPDRAVVLYFLAQDYAQIGDQQKAIALLKESIAAREGVNPADDATLRP